MTEAQPMKPTEIVSEYPMAEEDNVRHIDKTKEPSEDDTKQQEPATGRVLQWTPKGPKPFI